MRYMLVLLVLIVTSGPACDRQPASSPPPAAPQGSARPTDRDATPKETLRELPNVFAEAKAQGLRPGDCVAGTGQHQIRGGPPPTPGARVIPCEPTEQLYKRDPHRARVLADFARARKGERR